MSLPYPAVCRGAPHLYLQSTSFSETLATLIASSYWSQVTASSGIECPRLEKMKWIWLASYHHMTILLFWHSPELLSGAAMLSITIKFMKITLPPKMQSNIFLSKNLLTDGGDWRAVICLKYYWRSELKLQTQENPQSKRCYPEILFNYCYSYCDRSSDIARPVP